MLRGPPDRKWHKTSGQTASRTRDGGLHVAENCPAHRPHRRCRRLFHPDHTTSCAIRHVRRTGAIIDQLKAKYQETRQAVGLISNNGAAELYVSEKGTWTMLVTLGSGKSCIIAAGHYWDASPTLAQGTGI